MEFRNYIDARMYLQENKKWMKEKHLLELLGAAKRLSEAVIFPHDKKDLGVLIWDIEELVENPIIKPVKPIYSETLVIKKKETLEETPDVLVRISDFHSGNLMAKVERDLIRQCLNRFNGNRTLTASVLGICVRTLRNRLWEYRRAGLITEKELKTRRLC